jgi:hypothetical protein
MALTTRTLTRIAGTAVSLVALAACAPPTSGARGSGNEHSGGSAQSGGGVFPSAGGSATSGAAGNSTLGGTPNTPGLLAMVDASAAGPSGCKAATVAFLVDGSGSMCEPFGNSTRWTELRKALLDKTTGLIYKVDNLASFGMYLYDGSIDLSLAMTAAAGPASTCTSPGTFRRINMGDCPQIISVPPAPNNAAAIDQKYPTSELGGSTPTDKALNVVVDSLIKARPAAYNPTDNPQFIILATDGQPNDICTGGMGGDGTAQQTATVAAVDKAAAMGITTFVISLASDAMLQAQLDIVAKHGSPADPTAHTFSPMSSQDLVTTLTKLLNGALGCLF